MLADARHQAESLALAQGFSQVSVLSIDRVAYSDDWEVKLQLFK